MHPSSPKYSYSKYFIKQNQLSEITPEFFYRSILDKVDISYSDFESSSLFKSYLDSSLLPSIRLNNPTITFDTEKRSLSNALTIVMKHFQTKDLLEAKVELIEKGYPEYAKL